MSPTVLTILMLLLVLQIVGGLFALKMWKWFRVLVDVHASLACDAKTWAFVAFAAVLRIEQDNDKGTSNHDDVHTIVTHIGNMATDMCVNATIDARRYALDDMARVMFRLFRHRSKYHCLDIDQNPK